MIPRTARETTFHEGVAVAEIPATQHAIQFTGVDQIVHNTAKAVDPVGPTQMLLQVEACGICFSDTKLLHAFDSHPRKAEVVSGIDLDALAEIPGYRPGSQPTVPGHEPVGRIVAVGDQVTRYSVGDRVLVQADWKHLRTPKSNGAFGYNFEGALQEYVVIDERCVISPSGEEFLIHVTDGPSAAAVGLIEPWATVEGSYAWSERNHLADDGRLLVVTENGGAGVEALTADHQPGETSTVAPAEVATLEGQTFDDIIYFGADADVIEALTPLLGTRATFCVVLGGQRIQRKVKLDIGRVHYDFIRFVGTVGDDPAEAYAWVPATGEVRDGDRVAIIGAAGPMGQMHTIRAVTSGIGIASVDATDLSDDRLSHLATLVQPVADEKGIPITFINTGNTELQPGYTHISCMVPVPALVSQAVDLAADGAILNAFAGIPAGTLGDFDLQGIIERRIFMLGTSGSDVSDMRTVLDKIEKGVIDTHISLDAVTGMAGFTDAIESVMNRTSGGKIMVYPMLHDLGLTRLVDMPEKLPHVAAKLNDGVWTKEAEAALLAGE
nr:alcohol dehydrogenase catalytic domain-containing protein [Tessaracoccus sp. OS52]